MRPRQRKKIRMGINAASVRARLGNQALAEPPGGAIKSGSRGCVCVRTDGWSASKYREDMRVGSVALGRSGIGDRGTVQGTLSRRQLLKIGTVVAGCGLVPTAAVAALRVPYAPERSLKFYNLHTGESLSTVYCVNGRYIEGALSEINYLMRDFRANEVKAIDPRLLDLLYSLNRKLVTQQPFHLISGYRSPATNAMLAAHSEGVARHSLHIEGKAADIRVPDRSLWEVWRASMELLSGGVGYYPRSDFVHVDVGRVRFW